MKILIVYNPEAGRGCGIKHAEKLATAIRRLSKEAEVKMFSATSLKIMREFWHRNSENPHGFKIVALIGGDGTIGPNVDAMIKNKVKIPVFAYGRGTANDFASFFKTKMTAGRAARTILARKTIEIDTIQIENSNEETTYAVNVAGGGAFTNGVTTYKEKNKRLLGKYAYLLTSTMKILTLKSQLVCFTVSGVNGPGRIKTPASGEDEIAFEARVFLFYILNTRNAGSLKNAANLADASDGYLDLVIVKRCGFFGKIGILYAKSLKRLHCCKHIAYIQGRRFRVDPVGGAIHDFTRTDLDGNPGTPYPLEVTVGPKIEIVISPDIS